MRYTLVTASLLAALACTAPATHAGVSVGIGINVPGVSIGINVPVFPRFALVPGYPVYYAPELPQNYFFYDGMYWVFQGENWYASSWYNGPWGMVAPAAVPVYLLRVPVRYYRAPPPYFRGWRAEGPPRWGDHWGPGWQQEHPGWERGGWKGGGRPTPAPLPVYQRGYGAEHYPPAEQQQGLHGQNYRYQPREPVVREHYQQQRAERQGERGGERGGEHQR